MEKTSIFILLKSELIFKLMFKKALILGAFAAILGNVAAETTKSTKTQKDTKKRAKPTKEQAE